MGRRGWKRRTKAYRSTRSPGARGGAAIGAGGYGCVFRPPLTCASGEAPDVEGVSKLMVSRYAAAEMREIQKVRRYVQKIPNYSRYFLVDGVASCAPGVISDSDLQGFDDRCRVLFEKGYTRANINTKRNALRLINIPYGGIDVDRAWYNWRRSAGSDAERGRAFAAINTALVDLLLHAIVPMNTNGYLHMDLKGQNILIDGEAGEGVTAKIIDWGLSGAVPAKGVPASALDRSVQFNVPYSNILLNKGPVQSALTRDIRELAANEDLLGQDGVGRESAMKLAAFRQLNSVVEEYGRGHLSFLRGLYETVMGKPAGVSRDARGLDDGALGPAATISEYNAAVLSKYTGSDGKFDASKYYHEVYRWNVDLWGLLMAYLPLIEVSKNPWRAASLTNAVTRIICTYCFSPKYAAERIPVQQLARELISLNSIAGFPSDLPKPAPIEGPSPVGPVDSGPEGAPPPKNARGRARATRKVIVVKRDNDAFPWRGKRCPRGSRRCKRTRPAAEGILACCPKA